MTKITGLLIIEPHFHAFTCSYFDFCAGL